jgi:hypothetical protein
MSHEPVGVENPVTCGIPTAWAIKGIGPRTAARIVGHFGVDTRVPQLADRLDTEMAAELRKRVIVDGQACVQGSAFPQVEAL